MHESYETFVYRSAENWVRCEPILRIVLKAFKDGLIPSPEDVEYLWKRVDKENLPDQSEVSL